jgi:hypothetical protein
MCELEARMACWLTEGDAEWRDIRNLVDYLEIEIETKLL